MERASNTATLPQVTFTMHEEAGTFWAAAEGEGMERWSGAADTFEEMVKGCYDAVRFHGLSECTVVVLFPARGPTHLTDRGGSMSAETVTDGGVDIEAYKRVCKYLDEAQKNRFSIMGGSLYLVGRRENARDTEPIPRLTLLEALEMYEKSRRIQPTPEPSEGE